MPTHVIIGGTGAVGAVYADALIRGHDRVILYVRPKYKAQLDAQRVREGQAAIKIYDLNHRINAFIINNLLLVFTACFFFFWYLPRVGISHSYPLKFLEALAFYLCGRALIHVTPRA